jgi:hypothetical protein
MVASVAPLDLGHPAGSHSHGRGELGLGEAVAFAFFGKPLAALVAISACAAARLPPRRRPAQCRRRDPTWRSCHRPVSSSARSFR